MPDAETGVDSKESDVARLMLKGRVVPLLGAGVNACGRPKGFSWKHGDKKHLPTGGELAAWLAGEFTPDDPELANTEDLIRVSQYIDSGEHSSAEMYIELNKIFAAEYEPGPVHRFLASTAALLRENYPGQLQVILTTNYDDLLEQAFDHHLPEPEGYHLITYRAAPDPAELHKRFVHVTPDGPQVMDNSYSLGEEKQTVILKLHGAVRRGPSTEDRNYVITEDHYIDYLTDTDIGRQLPSVVKSQLMNSSYLFLGYGLKDWNLKAILRRLWGEETRPPSWAIQKLDEKMEKANNVDKAIWADPKRGVKIIGLDLEVYIERLQSALNQRLEQIAAESAP